jgi:hypothetical protein
MLDEAKGLARRLHWKKQENAESERRNSKKFISKPQETESRLKHQ